MLRTAPPRSRRPAGRATALTRSLCRPVTPCRAGRGGVLLIVKSGRGTIVAATSCWSGSAIRQELRRIREPDGGFAIIVVNRHGIAEPHHHPSNRSLRAGRPAPELAGRAGGLNRPPEHQGGCRRVYVTRDDCRLRNRRHDGPRNLNDEAHLEQPLHPGANRTPAWLACLGQPERRRKADRFIEG